MRLEVRTDWKKFDDDKRKKIGYTVYVLGKNDEIEKIDKISSFMSDETGVNFDGFGDDTNSWNCFFLEVDEFDLIQELKEAYKKGKEEIK